MKRNVIGALTILIASACSVGAPPPRPVDLVKRGEYLVTTMGCNDCHTPLTFSPELGIPVPDASRKLSGHPEGVPGPEGTVGARDGGLFGGTMTSVKLPFGVVYARNLTPDPDTGLGRWTEAQFIATMRTGRVMGAGRPLLPPMPWFNLAAASDEDLRAIFAYLPSLPPVKNAVPSPSVPDEVVQTLEKAYDHLTAGSSPGPT